jgi:flagellar capping protein FliD
MMKSEVDRLNALLKDKDNEIESWRRRYSELETSWTTRYTEMDNDWRTRYTELES